MKKNIIWILSVLFLISLGCNKQDKVATHVEHFKANGLLFSVTLPEGCAVLDDINPPSERGMQRIIFSKNTQKTLTKIDLTTTILTVPKKNQGMVSFASKNNLKESEIADYLQKALIEGTRSEAKNFQECEHPADYESTEKTIKRFIGKAEEPNNGNPYHFVISLVDFKGRDMALIVVQMVSSKSWEEDKSLLFGITDSIKIVNKAGNK